MALPCSTTTMTYVQTDWADGALFWAAGINYTAHALNHPYRSPHPQRNNKFNNWWTSRLTTLPEATSRALSAAPTLIPMSSRSWWFSASTTCNKMNRGEIMWIQAKPQRQSRCPRSSARRYTLGTCGKLLYSLNDNFDGTLQWKT